MGPGALPPGLGDSNNSGGHCKTPSMSEPKTHDSVKLIPAESTECPPSISAWWTQKEAAEVLRY
jgi:hypothetical protein